MSNENKIKSNSIIETFLILFMVLGTTIYLHSNPVLNDIYFHMNSTKDEICDLHLRVREIEQQNKELK